MPFSTVYTAGAACAAVAASLSFFLFTGDHPLIRLALPSGFSSDESAGGHHLFPFSEILSPLPPFVLHNITVDNYTDLFKDRWLVYLNVPWMNQSDVSQRVSKSIESVGELSIKNRVSLNFAQIDAYTEPGLAFILNAYDDYPCLRFIQNGSFYQLGKDVQEMWSSFSQENTTDWICEEVDLILAQPLKEEYLAAEQQRNKRYPIPREYITKDLTDEQKEDFFTEEPPGRTFIPERISEPLSPTWSTLDEKYVQLRQFGHAFYNDLREVIPEPFLRILTLLFAALCTLSLFHFLNYMKKKKLE